MTQTENITVESEQLVFDGFDRDFSEKTYVPSNIDLLRRCNSVVLEQCGISIKDFEARQEHADYIGVKQVQMHNLLYGVIDPTDTLIEELYIELAMKPFDEIEVSNG
jgi:hypothetical protein